MCQISGTGIITFDIAPVPSSLRNNFATFKKCVGHFDRLIQQALLQVLQPLIDPTFSAHSHGFRPGRSAHGAVLEAQQYVQAGYRVVVDVDLEKFFDRVNHDILMDRLAKRIADKRVLRLIRRYLQAGILAHGVQSERFEGTPQGGRLSKEMPVQISNVLLVCPSCGKATRSGARFGADGSKERFCKKCGSGMGQIAPARAAHAKKKN